MENMPGPWKEHKAHQDQSERGGSSGGLPPDKEPKGCLWTFGIVLFVLVMVGQCRGVEVFAFFKKR